MRQNSNIKAIQDGCSKTLQIGQIHRRDTGKYLLEAAGIESKPTQLKVKRMF